MIPSCCSIEVSAEFYQGPNPRPRPRRARHRAPDPHEGLAFRAGPGFWEKNNSAGVVSLYKHPPVRARALGHSAPAGTFAGRNATRHATHVHEVATYTSNINVLRGLAFSLPDKPVHA